MPSAYPQQEFSYENAQDRGGGGPVRSGRRFTNSRPASLHSTPHVSAANGDSHTPRNTPAFKRPFPVVDDSATPTGSVGRSGTNRRNSLTNSHSKPYDRPANTPKFKRKPVEEDSAARKEQESWLAGIFNTVTRPLKSFFSLISTSPEKPHRTIAPQMVRDSPDHFEEEHVEVDVALTRQDESFSVGKRRISIFDNDPQVFRDSLRPMQSSQGRSTTSSPFRFQDGDMPDSFGFKQPQKKQRTGTTAFDAAFPKFVESNGDYTSDVEASRLKTHQLLESFSPGPDVIDIVSKVYDVNDGAKPFVNSFMLPSVPRTRSVRDAATETVPEPVTQKRVSGDKVAESVHQKRGFGLVDDEEMAVNSADTSAQTRHFQTSPVLKSTWKEPSLNDFRTAEITTPFANANVNLSRAKTKSSSTSPVKFEESAAKTSKAKDKTSTSSSFAFSETVPSSALKVAEAPKASFAFAPPPVMETSPEKVESLKAMFNVTSPTAEEVKSPPSFSSAPVVLPSDKKAGFSFVAPSEPLATQPKESAPASLGFSFAAPAASGFKFDGAFVAKKEESPKSSAEVAKPSFSFGAPATVSAEASTPKLSTDSSIHSEASPKPFAFGAAAPLNAEAKIAPPSTAAPAFSFGAAAPIASQATEKTEGGKPTAAVAAPKLSFGTAPTADASSTFAAKPISFGTVAPVEASKPVQAFSFGTTSAVTEQAKPAEEPKPFSFGSTSEAAKPISLGASATATSTSAPLSFGTSPATTSPVLNTTPPATGGFTFGSAAPVAEAPKPFSFATGASQPFAFGSTPSKEEPVPPATSGFSFGSTSMKDEPTASTTFGFSFGSTPKKDEPLTTSGFSFGSTPKKDEPPTTSGFSFGSTPKKDEPPTTSGFSFGSTAPAQPSSFSFGASPAQHVANSMESESMDSENMASNPTPLFSSNAMSFGDLSKSGAPVTGGFSFGAASASTPSATPSFSFGASAPAPAAQPSSFNTELSFGQTRQAAPSQFGAQPTVTPAPSTGAFSFQFGAQPAQQQQPPQPFSFGGSGTSQQQQQQPPFGTASNNNSQNFTFQSAPAPQQQQSSFTFGSGSSNNSASNMPGGGAAHPFAFGAASNSAPPQTPQPGQGNALFNIGADTAPSGNRQIAQARPRRRR